MSLSVENSRVPCSGLDTREESIKKGCFVPDINTAPWVELDEWIGNYRRRNPEREIWKIIERSPINQDAIDKLIREGWKIEINYNVRCMCIPEIRVINLPRGFWGYDRDKALFHEIVHAVYGKESYDNFVGRFFASDNRAIVDWMARKSRSDSALLRHVITSFQLEPYVYDRVSLHAFGMAPMDPENQLAFRFGEEGIRALSRVRMDWGEYTHEYTSWEQFFPLRHEEQTDY